MIDLTKGATWADFAMERQDSSFYFIKQRAVLDILHINNGSEIVEGCQLPTVLESQQWNKASSSLSTPRTLNFIALAQRRNDALFEILTIGSKWKLVQTLLSTSPNIVGLIPEPSSQSAGFVLFYLERERGDFDSMWPFLSMGNLGNLDEACEVCLAQYHHIILWFFFFIKTSTKTTSWWETYLFEKEKAKSLEGLGKHENTGAV